MDKQETGNRLLPGVNPNINRGPYCVICGVEMNRPNHRFQAAILEDGSVRVTRFRGELSFGMEPICGEEHLQIWVARWASGAEPLLAVRT